MQGPPIGRAALDLLQEPQQEEVEDLLHEPEEHQEEEEEQQDPGAKVLDTHVTNQEPHQKPNLDRHSRNQEHQSSKQEPAACCKGN